MPRIDAPKRAEIPTENLTYSNDDAVGEGAFGKAYHVRNMDSNIHHQFRSNGTILTMARNTMLWSRKSRK